MTAGLNFHKLGSMDDKLKHDFIALFNQGFEEVVMPQIAILDEEIQGIKKTLHNMEQRMDRIEQRMDHMEQRMDRIENKLDRIAAKVTKHDQIIASKFSLT